MWDFWATFTHSNSLPTLQKVVANFKDKMFKCQVYHESSRIASNDQIN